MACAVCKKNGDDAFHKKVSIPVRFKESGVNLSLELIVPVDIDAGEKPFNPVCGICMNKAIRAAAGALWQEG